MKHRNTQKTLRTQKKDLKHRNTQKTLKIPKKD